MNAEQIQSFTDQAAQIQAAREKARSQVMVADKELLAAKQRDDAATAAAKRAIVTHDQQLSDLKAQMETALASYAQSQWAAFVPELESARNQFAAVLRRGFALCAAVGVTPDKEGDQHGIGTLLLQDVDGSHWQDDVVAEVTYNANSGPRLALENLG